MEKSDEGKGRWREGEMDKWQDKEKDGGRKGWRDGEMK